MAEYSYSSLSEPRVIDAQTEALAEEVRRLLARVRELEEAVDLLRTENAYLMRALRRNPRPK